MASIAAKESNLEDGDKSQGRCPKVAMRTQQGRPPFQGTTCRRGPWQTAADGPFDFRQPGCEPLPVNLEERQKSDDILTPRATLNKPFNRAVLNQAIGLSKGRKKTDGLMANPAAKAPDKNAEKSKLKTTDISRVIPKRPKCACVPAMRTVSRRLQALMNLLFGVTLWIACDGAD